MALKSSRGGREYDKFVADSGGDTALRTTSTSSVTSTTSSVGSDVYIDFDTGSIQISNLAGNLSISRLRDDTSAEWTTEVITQLDGGTF